MALTSSLLGDDFGFQIFVLDIQLCMRDLGDGGGWKKAEKLFK